MLCTNMTTTVKSCIFVCTQNTAIRLAKYALSEDNVI